MATSTRLPASTLQPLLAVGQHWDIGRKLPPHRQPCTHAHRPLLPFGHPFQDIARMNPGEAVKMDSEYKSFLAELGGAQPHAMDAAPQRGPCCCGLGCWWHA